MNTNQLEVQISTTQVKLQ